MQPGDPLFESFANHIELVTPSIFAHEATRTLTTDILNHVREHGTAIGIPRLGHYKTALQREMNSEWLVIPDGKIYITNSYEEFSTGDPAIKYETKLLVLTNDKDESKGRITNAVDKIFNENPRHKGVFVILGIVTPQETPKVTSVDALTFAVVQSNSGEAFGFTFRENPNKGKVRVTEGISDEFGDLRERIGFIDNCSIEALKLSQERLALVRIELQRAKTFFIDKPEDAKSSTLNGNLDRVQSLGKSLLDKVVHRKSKVSL